MYRKYSYKNLSLYNERLQFIDNIIPVQLYLVSYSYKIDYFHSIKNRMDLTIKKRYYF